ncbi:MAG: DUF58 domain-containing protein [Acutalibacter sp.]|jgi:uncharacterized protein (DUF58 family)
MWKNRLCYLLVLLGTGTFFVCFNGYLSLYVFVLSLVLPVVSLLLSLPGMLGLRATLTTSRQEGPNASANPGSNCARKGTSVPLQLAVWNTTPLSSGRARARLTVENTFTGQRQRESFTFTAGPRRQVFQHQLTSRTCGVVRCRLGALRVCDYLGLFSLPVGKPKELSAIFWPTVHPLELEVRESLIPDSEGERYSQKKPGDDPTELFALRDWREGDRLSRIHWKLSQKLGRTLVKELGQPLSDHLLFLLDLNGDGLQADLLLDAFASLSNALSQGEHAHRAAWTDPDSGQLQLREIAQPEDLLPLWQSLLAGGSQKPLSLENAEALPTGVSHVLYLCCSPQTGSLSLLEDRFPSAQLTVLQPSPAGEEPLPAGVSRILLEPGLLPQRLNGLTL